MLVLMATVSSILPKKKKTGPVESGAQRESVTYSHSEKTQSGDHKFDP